ncbi:MAG: ice-binding family protein, partial [Gammaproteobacteria bacterium]|nr:ice-binding family protein [Gammaproteobacteria bacterium]
MSALLAGCGGGGGGIGGTSELGSAAVLPGAAGTPGAAATDPTVGSANPSNTATNVPTSTNSPGNVVTGTLVSATFTQAMDPATIISPATTFTLKETVSGTNVPGTVTMNASNTVATFTPTAAALTPNTSYTATVSTAAKSAGGTAMGNPVVWSFTTNAVALTAQAPVNLGTAGNYVIFADTGITNATVCAAPCITGNMGVGPGVTSTAITGFGLVLPAASPFSTSAQVTGNIYARDYAAPTPANVTTASADMGLAYTDAAGRPAGVGPNLNLGGGTVTTQTLAPGVYTWGTAVTLPPGTVLTLSGSSTDVWIFQIAGTFTMAATSSVNLIGGALPKNVFWQVAGASMNVGAAPAHFEGVVLCGPICAVNVGNQATMNSRLLSQT